MLEWYEVLNLPNGGLVVVQTDSLRWGHDQQLVFLHNPHRDGHSFRLTFRDCQRVLWDWAGARVDERDTAADVIGFMIDPERQIAGLTTHLFELHIHYGDFILEKDW
jgi:hypothetical protein